MESKEFIQACENISLSRLLELWEQSNNQPRSDALYMVRGWLLDALEVKMGVEQFGKWLEANP